MKSRDTLKHDKNILFWESKYRLILEFFTYIIYYIIISTEKIILPVSFEKITGFWINDKISHQIKKEYPSYNNYVSSKYRYIRNIFVKVANKTWMAYILASKIIQEGNMMNTWLKGEFNIKLL